MKLQFRELEDFLIARNESWLQSVRLGFTAGVWYAPLTLWRTMREPLGTVGSGILYIVMGLFAWLCVRVVFVTSGFCGMVRLKERSSK